MFQFYQGIYSNLGQVFKQDSGALLNAILWQGQATWLNVNEKQQGHKQGRMLYFREEDRKTIPLRTASIFLSSIYVSNK